MTGPDISWTGQWIIGRS